MPEALRGSEPISLSTAQLPSPRQAFPRQPPLLLPGNPTPCAPGHTPALCPSSRFPERLPSTPPLPHPASPSWNPPAKVAFRSLQCWLVRPGWPPLPSPHSPPPVIACWFLASGLASPFISQPSCLHISAAFSVFRAGTYSTLRTVTATQPWPPTPITYGLILPNRSLSQLFKN